MNYITIIIISVAVIVLIIATTKIIIHRSATKSAQTKKEQDEAQHRKYLKEIISRDRQIKEQQNKIDEQDTIINRYLSFIFRVPTIVKRMNSTLKIQEITSSTIALVNEVLQTDKVEFYMYDMSDKLLKKLTVNGNSIEEQVSYPLGENLVGVAAKNRILTKREHYMKSYSSQDDDYDSESQLWMAAPIIFRDKLLGVIGIGEVEKPIGNESDLLKMIADITGVALNNCKTLDQARIKANTDSLTGLYNRNYFFQRSRSLIEQSIGDGSPISIFLFDIDNFKHYNDKNGHTAGDKLLIELSQLVLDVSRKESIIARYGGEEFIMMLPDISGDDAFVSADRVREKICTHPFFNRESQPLGCISISGGVATFPDDEDSLYKVIQLADRALYQAKSKGKNKVILYKQETSFDQDIREIVYKRQESSILK